jgi:hypothetical protein
LPAQVLTIELFIIFRLKELIELCWQPNPNARPNFDQIVTALNEIIVDCAIEDIVGRAFWKQVFLKTVLFP